MNMTVLIEPQNGRFKASTSNPVPLECDGDSREEALRKLQELAASRLAAGELVDVALPEVNQFHPWMKYAGIWKDHPDFDQFQQNIAEYRQSLMENEP